MGAKPLKVLLTLTEDEHKFFMRNAQNKTLWHLVHEELAQAFKGCSEPTGVCNGNRAKIRKNIDLPPRLARIIQCQSEKIGITPGQLIYRIVFAPHIMDVIKEKSSK